MQTRHLVVDDSDAGRIFTARTQWLIIHGRLVGNPFVPSAAHNVAFETVPQQPQPGGCLRARYSSLVIGACDARSLVAWPNRTLVDRDEIAGADTMTRKDSRPQAGQLQLLLRCAMGRSVSKIPQLSH